MERIFLISGKARHGKNTVADIMKEHLEYQNKKCLTIAYGDYLKYIAKVYFDWNSKKDEKGRQLLQYIGTDLVRIKLNKPSYWVDRVMDIIEMIQDKYDYIFITDCRFYNEIEIPKQLFPNLCTSIRVNRLNFKSDLTEEQLNHPSETALDDYKFDIYIESENGLDELTNKVLQTFNFLKPIQNIEVGDTVLVKNINDPDEAPHLTNYINKIGNVLSYININSKRKYKVLFNNNESAYFFGNELDKNH